MTIANPLFTPKPISIYNDSSGNEAVVSASGALSIGIVSPAAGQATMANSIPVVLASDQGSISVATKITAGDMSQDTLSYVTYLGAKRSFSVQAVFTGSPVGTLALMGSNDNSTFDALNGTSFNITTAGSILYNLVDQHYLYYKCIYTKSSGTGSLTVIECIKGLA